jgi:hypothetical protein
MLARGSGSADHVRESSFSDAPASRGCSCLFDACVRFTMGGVLLAKAIWLEKRALRHHREIALLEPASVDLGSRAPATCLACRPGAGMPTSFVVMAHGLVAWGEFPIAEPAARS